LDMLRARSDFAALQASGRSRSHRILTVRTRPNSLGHDRYAISTGRAVGNAVTRNRVRRRLREILRGAPRAARGRDILVVCRPGAAEADFQELRETVTRLIATGNHERTEGT
jgi:ribonuclease P protein component